MVFLTVASILLCVSGVIGQKIVSTGQHANEEFLWAVSVDRLSFNTSLTGFTSANYSLYIQDWSHVSVDGVTLVLFRVLIVDSSLNQAACYNGSTYSTVQSVSANGIDYRIDCGLAGSTLESQFTIISSINSLYNGSRVKVQSSVYSSSQVLTLQYCDNLNDNGNLKVDGGKDAEYNDIATYTCENSVLVINEIYDNTVSEYSTTCQYDAKWSNPQTKVDCWPVLSDPTTIGTHTESTPTPDSASSSYTAAASALTSPDCHQTAVKSTGAAIAIGIVVGIVIGIVATWAVCWWMSKRKNKAPAGDEKREPAYEPTYVDSQAFEPAYNVIGQEALEDGGHSAAYQQQFCI